ncbi:hypothetical protein AAZV13_20G040500 [Glycine max]
MQRAPVTVEEQLLQKAIKEECTWENLPKRIQATLSSKEEWHRRIIEICIKKRLQWNGCFARKVCKESEYYEEMMRYLRKNLALFPYHLAEYICRVMRVSPFRYYCDMIFEVMRNEQPYDSIPNFSAADALRLTGIGRNEFIDIMNKCRSKKIMWKLNKSIAKELLPTQPVDFPIEPWWGVCLVNFTLEEFKKLSEEEMAMIDKVCKEEANSFILFDPDVVKGLYSRGLIYFDVPVYPDDRFKGLKSHAVTLYEAGKLGHASIADLCKDLSTLEGAKFEGELQEFANHAFSLRCVLECLQSGGVASDAKVGEDKMNLVTVSNDEPSSPISEISLTDKSGESGITEAGMNNYDILSSDLEKLVEALASTEAAPSNMVGGTCSIPFEGDGSHVQEANEDGNLQNNDKLMVEESDVGTEMLKRKKKYRVDILRCESLASLAPATLDRLFVRDYDVVVSIVPLPFSSVLPGSTGLVHFGPPSYSFMTPWMKLVLYSTVASGPLSVVLMKGQCLRFLPAPLAGCEKALIWSWDGSTVGGLGGKHEGNLVKGSILLHCLNSLLKHSAVLVQPLSRFDLDESSKVITVDIPLPLKNSDGSIISVGKELGLCEGESSKLKSLLTNLANKMELWTVGYIRLLKLYNVRESNQFSPEEKYEWVPLSIEFGMPLFSPKVCNNICQRVVSSELLQSDSFEEHRHAMQNLRKNLCDICAEYQATGPAAKVLYQKEKAKESSRQLMNYASGRWNPLMDPSSPISGASSEHQRLKLANRQRCRTEVLSFDGSILRSYALTPVYEAATRPIEEATQANTIKAETDECDSKEVILPGVNLIFDGSELHPFDIGACLQARQPISLIAEATAGSASLATK